MAECLSYSENINDMIRSSDILILVLQLRRLEHARNTQRRLVFCLRLTLGLKLLLLEEQLCVVPRKLLELDQEVAQSELEPGDVVVVLAQANDKGLDLDTNESTPRQP